MTGFGPMAGFGLGWLGMLAGIILWVVLLAVVIWGISSLLPARPAGTTSSALEILKQRFARGEITEAEYEQARKILA